jgi:rRNA processing protein Gar1
MKEPRQVVARRGDVVAVTAHHVGESERIGEILEVLGDAEHPHFRVRWEDDRETIFYPSNDSVVRRRGR